jgi:hypothetical protein
MAEHHPVTIEPAELNRAQHTWRGFTQLMKYSVIFTVAALTLLALVFIDW